jgi:hypothetical protein
MKMSSTSLDPRAGTTEVKLPSLDFILSSFFFNLISVCGVPQGSVLSRTLFTPKDIVHKKCLIVKNHIVNSILFCFISLVSFGSTKRFCFRSTTIQHS